MSPTLTMMLMMLMMLMLVAFVDDKADARVDADADVDYLTRGHLMMKKTTKYVMMLRLKRMRLKLMKMMLK